MLKMYKIGLSSCGFALTAENFEKLEQNQIAAIEIALPLDQCNSTDYKEVQKLSGRYHIDLWSYHLPFCPFRIIDIASLNPELRENSIKLYTSLIEKAADVGVDKFVVHPSAEPIAPNDRSDRLKYSMQTLDQLAEIAHRNGAVIAVEDLPRTCLGNTAQEIQQLISANDKLRVCLDTNHLLSESNTNFVKQLSDKIVTMHVSDYDFVDEKHWLPGEGKVDWQALLSALQQVNYQGVWMYEIGLTAPKTLSRSRDLTFADFVKNATAIFNGKAPERIS